MPDREVGGHKDRFDTQIVPATIDDAPAILDLQKLAYHTEAILYDDWSIPPLTQTLAELRAELRLNPLRAIRISALGRRQLWSDPTTEEKESAHNCFARSKS